MPPSTSAGPSSSTPACSASRRSGMWPAEGSRVPDDAAAAGPARHPLDRHRRGDPQRLDAGLRQPRQPGPRPQSRPHVSPLQGARRRTRAGHRLPRPRPERPDRLPLPAQRAGGGGRRFRRAACTASARRSTATSRPWSASSSTARTAGNTIPAAAWTFLRALYRRCTTTPGIRPVTIGDYLEKHPPRDTLPHLFAGSWINHNFAIWIGHEEDNTAWDALHRTREHLRADAVQRRAGPPSRPRRQSAIAGLGGDLHRRGQRLVLVVRRRPFQRPGRAVRLPVPQALAERLPAAGRRRRRRTWPGRSAGAASGPMHTLPRALPRRQDRRPADVLRMDQRRPLHLPERARHDGHGDARAAQGRLLRLQPANAVHPRRLRRPGPRRCWPTSTPCASASSSRPAARSLTCTAGRAAAVP